MFLYILKEEKKIRIKLNVNFEKFSLHWKKNSYANQCKTFFFKSYIYSYEK